MATIVDAGQFDRMVRGVYQRIKAIYVNRLWLEFELGILSIDDLNVCLDALDKAR